MISGMADWFGSGDFPEDELFRSASGSDMVT
jgi:hypothetical protein